MEECYTCHECTGRAFAIYNTHIECTRCGETYAPEGFNYLELPREFNKQSGGGE